jgi:flagellar biosynthetic protein FlhB
MAEHTGTEAPTPRRREQARDEGQVVFSTDLLAAVTMLAACLILMWTGEGLAKRMMDSFRQWFTDVPSSEWESWHVSIGARWLSVELVTMCGILVIGLMAIGLAFGFAQVGFHISFQALAIKWERVLPENGFSRIVSMESGIRGMLSAAKVSLLMIVAVILLWMKRSQLSIQNFSTVKSVASAGWNLGLGICISLAGITIGLALVDYLIKWFRHEQSLMMTREEIKQEHKDDTGDPHLKAAIRRKQREARKQMSTKDVSKATVVLKNPTHLAIAIQYEPGKMRAPKVVAKGAGLFAQNIIKIANEHGVPVLERKPLARALFKSCSVGQEIPIEFFMAIAEILGELFRQKRSAV